MDPITILIADDHRLLRELWSDILSRDPRFRVIGSSGDGDEIIMMVQKFVPNIILMDVVMSPIDGIDLTRQINTHQRMSKVIGVSMFTHPAFARKMVKAGAKGYLTKDSSKEEVIDAILKVHEGHTYVCEAIRDFVMDVDFMLSEQATISLRELQVITFMKEGLSSREIARELAVNQKTVEAHRYNIMKKLGLPNAAAVVNWANGKGI